MSSVPDGESEAVSARGDRVFRGAKEQFLLCVVTLLFVGGMAWQFAQLSRDSWQGDSVFAVLVAAFGWFGFRAGFRCRLVIRESGLEIVNPIRTTHVPFSCFENVSFGTYFLNIVTSDGKVAVLGYGQSLLETGFGRGEKITNAILAEVNDRRIGIDARDRVRTEVRSEMWVFAVLLTVFVGEIAARRLLT